MKFNFKDLILPMYDNIEPKDRLDYFEGCLNVLSIKEEHKKYLQYSEKMRNLLIWCDYEDLPHFVATILAHDGCDIEQVLLDIRDEQEQLDEEASRDYYEMVRDAERAQGWC